MQLTLGAVFAQLIAEELATPESVSRARAALAGALDTAPPWYARVIAGIGAWIATGCLIGFLVIADLVDGEASAIVVGIVLIAVGVYLRRGAEPREDFKRQLALAVNLAGQTLLIVGVRATTESTTAAALVALATSGALIAVVSDQVHRFMSALIASVALVAIGASLDLAWPLGSLGPLGPIVLRGSDLAGAILVAVVAYVWRIGSRERSRETAELLDAVGYGALAALLAILVFSSWFAVLEDFTRGQRSAASAWTLGAGTTIAIAIALSALMVAILHELRARNVTAVTPVVLALLTLPTPGIIAAVSLLVLGFDRRNRVLIGLAAAFLVKFVSMYYYSLTLTLLQKSIVLVASGLLLLAARAFLELRYRPDEATG